MMDFWQFHPYTVVGFLAFGLVTAIANHLFLRRPRTATSRPSALLPFVSILVPARNEAANIAACIESLLAQDYPRFEVIVCDDGSEDDTRLILERLSSQPDKLRIINSQPRPAGWFGKHWACHQLSIAAIGELLLFTDADTRHNLNMLHDTISTLLEKKADLLTAFPKEELVTWGEKLTVPILSFALFSFLPLPLAYWFKLPFLSVTLGQLMLFRRSAYEAIGGYEAIAASPVDDVTLGRRIIEFGYHWLPVDGTRLLSCRMYSNFQDALEGFSKNLFSFFDQHTLLYLIAWGWIGVAFLTPPVILILNLFGLQPSLFPVQLARVALAESLLLFAIAYYRFRFPFFLVFLYPVSLALFVFIAFRSFFFTIYGKSIWKGRTLPRSRLRW